MDVDEHKETKLIRELRNLSVEEFELCRPPGARVERSNMGFKVGEALHELHHSAAYRRPWSDKSM